MIPYSSGIPEAAENPRAAEFPESGTGITTSASTARLHRVFLGERAPEPLAHEMDALPENPGVRPGEVDVLENAVRMAAVVGRDLLGLDSFRRNEKHFPRLDFPHGLSVHHVESAG